MAIDDIRVSVIMPMYNVQEYIAESIESVLMQSMGDFELIIIDDNSLDQSYEIASAYAKQDKRIILLKQEIVKGPSAARNHGLQWAKGKYIFFIDADDLITQNALELLMETAVREQADLVVGHHEMFNSQMKELAWIFGNFPRLKEKGHKDIVTHPELFQIPYCWGKLFKKDLLKDNSFPENINFGEDQVFITRAYLKAEKIYLLDLVLYHYRKREGQITQPTHFVPENYLSDIIQVFKLVEKQFQNWDGNDHTRNELYAYYLDSYLFRNLFSFLANGLLSDHVPTQLSVLRQYQEWLHSMEPDIFIRISDGLKDINVRIGKMKSIFDEEVQEVCEGLVKLVKIKMPDHSNCNSLQAISSGIPIITIQTVAYNVEKYIRECAESVLNQTFTNFEWLVIDNGSTDKTGEILKEYALKDSRIKLFKSERNSIINNEDLHPEFVESINNLQSKYWCVLDSDDYLHVDFLKELYSTAEKYNADIAVAGTEKFYEGDVQPRETRRCPDLYAEDISQLGDVFPEIYFMFSVEWGKLVKVSLLMELLEYRRNHSKMLKHADDTLFSMEMLRFTNSVVGVNKTLHHYRIRQNSYYHSQIDKDRYLDYVLIYQNMKELLEGWNKLSERNFNFIVEKMFFSIQVCLEITSKSESVHIEDKLKGIELILTNEVLVEVFTEKNLLSHLFSIVEKAMDLIIGKYKNEPLPILLTNYVYRLFTAIQMVNSSEGNKQNAFLLYMSSICDKNNTTCFGVMFLYPFLSSVRNNYFLHLEKNNIHSQFLASNALILREIVNSRFDKAIELCDEKVGNPDYDLLKEELKQLSPQIEIEVIEKMNSHISELIDNNNYDEAIDLLFNVLEVCPLNRKALLYKLQLLMENDDLITAVETAEVLKVFYSDDCDVLVIVARTLEGAGLKQQAREIWYEALDICVDNTKRMEIARELQSNMGDGKL
ncbi:glycosyltransferase [Paenibacillus crassostreae]|uniref:Glycosyltransferase 2-like domain-containing protein n=1 Tax=Paenibacillus crassostreae TaxID=1763538 RepID=A0A162KUC8_9BACL|nr:glycosyltransferase [Paenibacillus crassostreae]AOZ93250.1 hypothetical protein LPB68_14215 [Paenibacillus crassostreae]OAB74073.1 hypothetical protein PNBC_13055 [Paenibacillus crassostreae]